MNKPKIAIAGFGQEGQANLRYFGQRGQLTVADQQAVDLGDMADGVDLLTGADAFEQLADFDLVLRSPGIAPSKIKTNGKIWSATNEFFAKCPAPIIGVTGTKGKGTTSSLIVAILRQTGKTVHLVGNIGQPALDSLAQIKPDDIVVYELSSFQLWDVKYSPQVAVVLMIEADHLDIHADMADYIAAKAQIVARQQSGDTVIYNAQNQYSQQVAASSPAVSKIDYQALDISQYKDSLQLPGEHNQSNLAAAVAAAQAITTVSPEQIKQGVAEFKGLEHRLQYVATVAQVDYYDDSISTTPGSAMAAIKAFADRPVTIILGGRDKGADYQQLIELCASRQATIIAVGENGPAIAQLADQYGAKYQLTAGAMPEVVSLAKQLTSSGGAVILSPAAASFDQYKNYVERGQKFSASVRQLG